MNLSLFQDCTDAGAVFSECGAYRYRLWRRWGDGPIQCWVLLNPSTADEIQDDPTVGRCARRARGDGFEAIEVVNIFAYRSTDRSVLKTLADPVGPGNDAAIDTAAKTATASGGQVVCGWGNDGVIAGRGADVMAMLERAGAVPGALTVTRRGQPGHPLYIAYSVRPRPLSALAPM